MGTSDWLTKCGCHRGCRHRVLDEAVANFDADGDGELSRDERKSAKQARRVAFEAQLDVNEDGVVSDAERAGFEEVHKGHGKKRHGKKS